VDVPASGNVLVSVTSAVVGNSGQTSCEMSYTVTGANVRPASDSTAVILAGQTGGQTLQRASAASLLTGLTPGPTTLTAVYRAQGSGTVNCTFSDRTIVALPLP
jgi:hypothetical protein